MRVLIDGYNVLHALHMIPATVQQGELQAARTQLLDLIADHLEQDAAHCTVVFDAARGSSILNRDGVHRGIEIRFSQKREEADDLIEWLVKQCSTPKQLIVVSTDHRLREAAHRRKATALLSQDFLDWLEKQKLKRKRNTDLPNPAGHENLERIPPMKEEEKKAWLSEFEHLETDDEFKEPSIEEELLTRPARRDETKLRAKRPDKFGE